MSQENMEIMRTNFEEWNAGNMDAVRESFDPDVIMRTPEGWPEPGPYMGRQAVMRQLEQNRATWDADTFEAISDFIDAADRVVVRMIWHGEGQGPESNMELTHVYTLRQGKIVFMEYFWDDAEALKTLGLSEQAMSQENVEAVRRIFEAWASGDWSIGNDYLDEHAVCVVSSDFPAFGAYFGLDGIRAYWRDFLAQ